MTFKQLTSAEIQFVAGGGRCGTPYPGHPTPNPDPGPDPESGITTIGGFNPVALNPQPFPPIAAGLNLGRAL
jgi:hypothetical protein